MLSIWKEDATHDVGQEHCASALGLVPFLCKYQYFWWDIIVVVYLIFSMISWCHYLIYISYIYIQYCGLFFSSFISWLKSVDADANRVIAAILNDVILLSDNGINFCFLLGMESWNWKPKLLQGCIISSCCSTGCETWASRIRHMRHNIECGNLDIIFLLHHIMNYLLFMSELETENMNVLVDL